MSVARAQPHHVALPSVRRFARINRARKVVVAISVDVGAHACRTTERYARVGRAAVLGRVHATATGVVACVNRAIVAVGAGNGSLHTNAASLLAARIDDAIVGAQARLRRVNAAAKRALV